MKEEHSTGRPQHMGNTRNEDQRRKMEEAQRLGHCTFCYAHLEKYHDAPIELEGEYWVATRNDYPYAHTKLHMLFIPKRHVEHDDGLTDAEWMEFRKLKQSIANKYNVPGGAIFMRFGDEDYSGGTLPHLHAHLVMPDLDDPQYQSVTCYVGTRRENLKK